MTLALRYHWQGRGHREPLPPLHLLTSPPDGGFHTWVVPVALELDGLTLIGWISGTGHVRCARYDAAAQLLEGPYTIHANFQIDAHDPPALLRRTSDQRLLALYSLHNAGTINLRTSTSPNDPSSWGSATNLDTQLGGSRYTDYALHQLTSEADDPIYLWVRDEPTAGTDSRWRYAKSLDQGASWGPLVTVYRVANARSYLTSCSDGLGRMHFIVTNGGTTVSGEGYTGFTALGHFYYDGGEFYRSDGSAMGSPPFSFASTSLVYAGTKSVFMTGVVLDANGYPVVASSDVIAGENRYVYHRWDGAAWNSTDLGSAGGGYAYNQGGELQGYGAQVDDGDPDVVWALVKHGAYPELFRLHTPDGGNTFTRLLVPGASSLQTAVVPVRGAQAGLRAAWLHGTWTHYTNWSMGIKGVGG